MSGSAGRPTMLTVEEEGHLLNYIDNMGRWGWPLTVPVIKVLAREVALRRPGRPRQPLHDNFPTPKWWQSFRARHARLLRTNIKPDKIDRGQASVSVEDIRDWWKTTHELLESTGVQRDPRRVWNVDESGYDRSITKVGSYLKQTTC